MSKPKDKKDVHTQKCFEAAMLDDGPFSCICYERKKGRQKSKTPVAGLEK